MITRCPKCTGKKTIMGLGCIIHKCPECSGIGHIKIEEKKNPLQAIDEEIKETFNPNFTKDLRGNIVNSTNNVVTDVIKIDRRKKEFRQVRS